MVFGVYCILDVWQAIYGNFNYAINRTRMIMWLGVFSAVVNIPISIILAKTFMLGIMGIKLGTLVSLFPSWCCIIIGTSIFIHKMD